MCFLLNVNKSERNPHPALTDVLILIHKSILIFVNILQRFLENIFMKVIKR